ncbi:hypothetical protein GCK72_020259 [Caenorhabditis remanei]|uniref:Uncharacterized protein n=1 Tax=Caenorhabditis remanei TaxID=31234 RepID=A0A6A5GGR9_CAERE|nr:hypothetical protein GCK72_020259 [Caenorhabditis remanei]KAF1753702.1 hypothetical protein GCK72_020259 [Caenorhabditis remanei]
MSVPPLLDLTTHRVITCIRAGTFPPIPYQLDPDLSKRLFDEHNRIFDGAVTRSVAKDLCSLLNVTEIDISNAILTRNELIILKNMNLVSLAMGDLTELGPNNTESHNRIKLEAMLRKCLNETTLQQLRHLDLSSTGVYYFRGWLENVSKMFPSLVSFSVASEQLSLTEFRTICTNFRNLRVLDISDTGLRSLGGISNLPNIEILAIGGLRSLTSLGMLEIFELKKIRVLDLSSRIDLRAHTWMFDRFLDCNKVLPELRSIDLSGTFILLDRLENFIKTHPTLEQISLLETSCSDLQMVYPGIQILVQKCLPTACVSLSHYTKLKNYNSTEVVLENTFWLMIEKLDKENESTIRDWFRAICEAIKQFPTGVCIDKWALKCLDQISRKQRIHTLSLAERHELVNVLFKLCDDRLDYKEDELEAEVIHGVWLILGNTYFLSTPNLNVRKIFENALEYCLIEKARPIQSVCMKIMKYTFEIMKPEDQKEMFGNLDICRDIVESLNFFYRLKQFKKYQFVLKFIIKLVEYHPVNFVKAGGVSIFVRHLIRYSQVESLKMLIVLALTGNSEFIRELSTPENVRGFVRYLHKCKPKLNYFTNVNSVSEKTFLVCCILSVIVYSIDEKRFNSIYWKNIVKLLKEVLTTLAEEPGYPCVHLEEVFETYFEKRTIDVKGPIQDIQCHREEKGACFYC